LKHGLQFLDLRELVRFSIVGGGSVIAYIVAIFFLHKILDLLVASVVAYCLSMIVNYFLQKIWTFRSDRSHFQTGPRYLVIHLAGIAINTLTLALLVETFLIRFALAQLIAFGLIATWSYFLQKFWAFTPKVETQILNE